MDLPTGMYNQEAFDRILCYCRMLGKISAVLDVGTVSCRRRHHHHHHHQHRRVIIIVVIVIELSRSWVNC